MSKLLIVTEGVTDEAFFKALSKRMKWDDVIEVTERAGKDKGLLDAFLKERLTDYYGRGIGKDCLQKTRLCGIAIACGLGQYCRADARQGEPAAIPEFSRRKAR